MRQFRCALLVGLLLSLLSLQASGFNLYRICQSNDTFTLNFNPATDTCGATKFTGRPTPASLFNW